MNIHRNLGRPGCAVRGALERGEFLFVHAPGGRVDSPPPVIRSIEVATDAAAIQIRADGHGRIEWISDGRTVHRGDRIELARVAGLGIYLRAMVHARRGGAVVGTQPFRIVRRSKVSNAPGTVPEERPAVS